MTGSDTSRGVNFQYAWAISFMLNFPLEHHWHTLQLEGEQDIEDILVLDDQGKVLVRAQVKQREDPHQWKPSDLREVLLAFARCPSYEETIYQFIYAGSEGKTITDKIKPIMQKKDFEGYEVLTPSEVQILRKNFKDEEVITFLHKIGRRLRLINCGPWKDIKIRDLGRINQLNLPKGFSRINDLSAEQVYSRLFEEIAQKTEPSSRYYRRMERKEILTLLQGDAVVVEILPELGQYSFDHVKSYLDRFAEHLTALPEYYPKDKFSFDQIRQRVKISRERLLYEQEQVLPREIARRSGFLEDDNEARQKHLEMAYQRRGAEMYEIEEGQATREEILADWEDIRNRFDRAIILGDPGFGKSWLLRYEGCYIAREQLLRFQEGPVNEKDIYVPIHARLGTLAETLEEKDPDLLETILLVVQREYVVPDHFVQWMRRIIPTAQCILLLDALDEVDEDKKQRLVDALERLAENSKCRIFLTSRIAGYRKAPFTLKNSKLDLELELVAFDWPQVATFVSSWFNKDGEKAQKLINILRREPVLRSQARIPLLLSFICLVAMSKVDIPTKRAELYETILRRLLEGAWKELHLREYDEGRLEEKVRLLMHVAWHFASSKNHWRDLLPGNELSNVIELAPQVGHLTQNIPHNSTLLWELNERDGILVKAGEPALGMAKSQVPYLFLHRTFHEYLVASYLSTLDATQWLSHVRAHLWFDPDWEVVIILLAGCLKEPQLLIETLLNEPDDVFHTQLLLAGHCLAETRKGSVDHKLYHKITTKLLSLLHSASERDRNQASLVVGILGNSMLSEISDILSRREEKDYIRATFVKTLGQIGNSAVLDDLLTILRDASESWKVRAAAARALGQINDDRTVEDIVEATKDKYVGVRIAALDALAQFGDSEAIDGLLAVVLDPQEESLVREAASGVLKQLGRPAEDKLLEMLQNRRRKDSYVSFCLFTELTNFGGSRVIEFLTEILNNRSESASSRHYAVDGLSKICGLRVLEKLLAVLYDPDEYDYLKLAIIKALGTIGGKKAAQILTSLLKQNNNRAVRKEIARALREIGDPYATEGIILAFHDKSIEVRREVMTFLENVSDQRVIDLLLQVALNDKNESIRQSAVWSLARQKNDQLIDYWLEALVNQQDKSHYTRWAASAGLGKIGDDRLQVIEKLTTVLLDKGDNLYIRRNVAESLAEIGNPIAIENLLIVLTNKDEYLPLRQKAADAIEKLIQACDPVSFCELVFKYWARGRQVRGCNSVLYSFLVRVAPRVRGKVGEDWQEWRNRLMPYTTQMIDAK